MQKNRILNNVWLKAAVLGCLWASSEIILGSFLHNLKIPFRSNILTGVGIVLLISVAHIWKEKGLFWRAGLICALMKSISPSAIIFGPMVAIFSQSLLMEFSVRVFRRNIFSFLLAGVLAMSWNLFHMIGNYVILYGSNIIDLYKNLTKHTQLLLNIESDNIWVPILFLLALYALMGFAAAVFGIYIGKKTLKYPISTKSLSVEQVMQIKSTKADNSFNFSIVALMLNIMALAGLLFLISLGRFFLWAPAGICMIIIWGYRYRRSLKPLAKPKFWIFFVLITFLSAYVLYALSSTGGSAIKGLLLGLEMNFRAALTIIGFSTIGTELRNPYLKNLFKQTRFKHAGIALEVAFDALPVVVANLPQLKDIFVKPVKVFHELVSQLDFWLDKVELRMLKRDNIIFITGHEKTGKTTLLSKIVEQLEQNGIKPGGFISPAIILDGVFAGYDLISLKESTSYVLSRTTADENKPKVGPFYFEPETLKIGVQLLDTQNLEDFDIVIIDEVGPWELKNNGWSGALNLLLKHSDKPMLWVVRESITEKAIQHWSLEKPLIINVNENNAIEASDKIMEFLKMKN